MYSDQTPQLPNYQVTTLGATDWGAILNLISGGIKKIGNAIVSSAYNPNSGGRYTLPPIKQAVPQSSGISSTTIFTIVALGSVLLLGGYLVLKKNKKTVITKSSKK